MVSPRTLGCLAVLGMSLGCAFDLPEEALVEGPRVLGIRVVEQDADDAAAPQAALALGTAAQIEVLAVDELGLIDPASVSAQWFACALEVGASAFSCLESTLPLERESVVACPDTADATELLPQPCSLSDALEPEFIVPGFSQAQAGARLELTLVLAINGQRELSACTNALLRGDYDTPSGCLYTSYTLTIARPDEDPNRHPSPFITAQVGGDAIELAAGDGIEIAPGESLELSYVPRVDDVETYRLPINNGADFEMTNEEPTVSWFRTGGTFISDARFGMPSNEIELRTDDESTRVYAVVRDERGGLGWWWADVTVR